ncbi:hypothetical protein PFICI_08379 [Pestalotiopsis fici W106-1]|uniref:Uncharacterized protein n=1 Tax=Pestalotiopsis fici (strain W106-1 / CGMCC3.15140) TaxID=1229662 RepID=W3X465_PESFW|nr:uncharacterized protein PFICI_08379 [Pestalotiopsis fici W106-1]ETS80850.1 hypothetical protein PFICI_08379 [Pestalotiopsis fici W106-1]
MVVSDLDSSEELMIRLPNLFTDVMAGQYAKNVFYEKVKSVAERWIEQTLKMDEKAVERNKKADFCLLSALWTPEGDEWGLRLVTDWNHWAFPWDDQFDEGHLKLDAPKAADEVMNTLAILDDTQPLISTEENPISHAFQTVWLHFKEVRHSTVVLVWRMSLF